MFLRRLAAVSLVCVSLSALDTKALLEQVRRAPSPTAALTQAETPKELGFIEYTIARVYQSQSNRTAAIPWFEKALGTHRSFRDRFQEAVILNNWALAETDLGQTSAAKDHFEEALTIRREIRDEPGVACTLLGLANVYAVWGNLSVALQTYETVAAQWRKLQNVVGEAQAVNNGGLMLAALALTLVLGISASRFTFELRAECSGETRVSIERNGPQGTLAGSRTVWVTPAAPPPPISRP